MTTGDPTHRGQTPVPVDLVGHFKELGRALLPALIIALLVGGAVYGLRSAFAEKQYSATIYTQIAPSQTPVPGDAFVEQLRAPFMGLALDNDVLNQVLAQVNVGWDADTLRSHVQLSPGPSPQLLLFTVTADTPALAKQLAESMVVTVAQAAQANHERDVGKQLEQVRATIAVEEASTAALAPDDPARASSDRRLADLRAQLQQLQGSGGDRISVLAVPVQNLHYVSPQPSSEAMVAGLVAFIVAAELIVLFRSRVGTTPNRTWARRMANKYGAEFDADSTAPLPTLAAAHIAQLQRSGSEVLVLLGPEAVFPAAARTGTGHRRTLTELPLDSPWWERADAESLGAAVLVVSAAAPSRAAAEQALRQLMALDVPRWLVVQPAPRKRKPAKNQGPSVADRPTETDAVTAPTSRAGENDGS